LNMRKFRKDDTEVNMAPLIDVVFLLLIFFMVTTTFREESEIQIDLPKAANEPMDAMPEAIEVIIDRDGKFYVDDQALINTQVDTLKRAFRQSLGERQNVPVIVSADANAPHQAVVKAMDAARQVGLSKLSIATRNFKEE